MNKNYHFIALTTPFMFVLRCLSETMTTGLTSPLFQPWCTHNCINYHQYCDEFNNN